MSLLDELRHLFRQQITLEPYAGMDAYTQPTWGDAVTYQARVQQQAKRVRTPQGEEVTSMSQVYLYGAPDTLTLLDRLTLPAPLSPSQPPLLAIRRSQDRDGMLVTVLYA